MCLIINKDKHPNLEPLTAQEDIVVYKLLHKKGNEFFSPIKNFKYTMGETYHAEMNLQLGENPNYRIYFVFAGLHAFICPYPSIEWLEQLLFYFGVYLDTIIVKCIIPQGSKYFVGNDDEIVSNALKILNVALYPTGFNDREETIKLAKKYFRV